MDRQEFFLDEYQMGGYLLNHNMTCDTAQNDTTLCLSMDASGGKTMNANDKILIYFPNGNGEKDLTNDEGKSIIEHLYGDNWQITCVDHHPLYKTRVWTLQPERTYHMAQGESVSVEFTQIQVNTVPGMSKLCLAGKGDELQGDIHKYSKPEEVSITIKPQEFVYGDDISVCFTVTNPGQYKYMTYCGRQLDKTKSSFEEKETAACDAEYIVEITNEADYKVQSIYTVCLKGLLSWSIKSITQEGVELELELTEGNVDRCRLHDAGSGKDWELAVKSGNQKVEMEINEDYVFYPIVSLKGSTRQEQGEKMDFHMPVIKYFGTSPEYAMEDVEGFLSVEQVKESEISHTNDCKSPYHPTQTLYYELEHVTECWIVFEGKKTEVDVNGTSISVDYYMRSGTVHATGDYGYEVTKDVSW